MGAGGRGGGGEVVRRWWGLCEEKGTHRSMPDDADAQLHYAVNLLGIVIFGVVVAYHFLVRRDEPL
jgi:hypothetical protein